MTKKATLSSKIRFLALLVKKIRLAYRTYIHYYPRVTLKTYLPVKRIGNKFLVLPRDNNGYASEGKAKNIKLRRLFSAILANSAIFGRLYRALF